MKLKLLLAFILLLDVGYSFKQHYHIPLDGDMAGGIVPEQAVLPILENPLGWVIFMENRSYANPNRFFSHWSLYKYFNIVPKVLQRFTDPIRSVFLACAFAKITTQILFIFLLTLLATGLNFFKRDAMIVACLIFQLIQTNGFYDTMGLINKAPTYTFFYGLPIAILLLYLIPPLLLIFHDEKVVKSTFLKISWLGLALVASLSCPLNPGVSLIIISLYFIKVLVDVANGVPLEQQKNFKEISFYFIPLGIFSAYALVLGQYNSLHLMNKIPLLDIYAKLPLGIFSSFFQKLAFPLLFVMLFWNRYILSRLKNEYAQKLVKAYRWVGLFALCYILLLPLGGHREYRPETLRFDTIIPLTLSIILLLASTTIHVLRNYRHKNYWLVLGVVLLIFTIADKPHFDQNACQIESIFKIQNTSKPIVKLDQECTVLSWDYFENPEKSKLNMTLLKRWHIVDEEKLYYYQQVGHSK